MLDDDEVEKQLEKDMEEAIRKHIAEWEKEHGRPYPRDPFEGVPTFRMHTDGKTTTVEDNLTDAVFVCPKCDELAKHPHTCAQEKASC